MKRTFYLLMLLVGFSVFAQEKKSTPCLTQGIMDQLIRENPEVKQRLDSMDKQINSRKLAKSGSLPMLTIPVVIYVVHGGVNNPENISDAQVTSQIVALNEYFADYGLKFCLATRAGAGTTTIPLSKPATDVQTTPGIIHVQSATLTNHSISDWTLLEQTAHNNITRDRYLRIWVVKSIDNSTVKGYAMFPNTSSFDGIVMKYDVFGKTGCSSCNLDPLFLQGKTLVHEVGHYLGLYHTFHEGCSEIGTANCADKGDRVCDTPPSKEANYNCSNMDSCPSDAFADDVLNYMDYGNECSSHFTDGQQARMMSTLNTQRQQLVTHANLVFTGACGIASPISANFTADAYTVCANTSNPVQFTAEAQTNVTYSWDFGDGSTSSSTSNTVTHLYNSTVNSPFTVTLTATNSVTNEATLSQSQIFVTTCSPINNSDSRWFIGSNNMLNFSSGLPVFDQNYNTTGIYAYASAIQNNASGNLLFYTDKQYIYNSSYTKTNPNTPLVLNALQQSEKNSVLIVPRPGTSSQYYIFTNTSTAGGTDNGFRYNIVNSNGVLSSTRVPVNFPASSGFTANPTDGALTGGTGIVAIQKSDGYWIITTLEKTPLQAQYDRYLAVYNLTSAGLVYMSSILIQTPNIISFEGIKRLDAAPNGNKIAVTANNSFTYVYDFNKITGQIFTSPLQLKNSGSYGISFSPDSKLVYISDGSMICQFNLSVRSADNGKIEIGKILNQDNASSSFGQIQLGPDGKLYVAVTKSDPPLYIGSRELAVIHKPNEVASVDNPDACLFSIHGPKNATKPINVELPNMIDAKNATVYNNTISYYPMGCGSYRFFPNIVGTSGTSTFSWEFKNQAGTTIGTLAATNNCPTRTFAPGTYTVNVKNGTTVLATVSLTVEAMADPVILGSDAACATSNQGSHNSVVLEDGSKAVWTIIGGSGTIQGANNQPEVSIVWKSLPGTISVTVTNENGCTKTVTKIIQSNCPSGANDYVNVVKSRGIEQIYFGGNFTEYNGVTRNRIARLKMDMSLDENFDPGIGPNDAIAAIAIQNDGKPVIGGYFTSLNGQPKSGIARLTTSGAIDSSFAGSGIAGEVNAIEIQYSTYIIAGGVFEAYNGIPSYNIVRINPNGSKDATFDTTQLMNLGLNIQSLAIQSDNRIIVGGSSETSNVILVRLNANGTIDNTFTPFIATSWEYSINSIKVMSDGKILIGGWYDHSLGGNVYSNFSRLNPDGSFDSTFIPSDIRMLPRRANRPIRAIEIQEDGKIIIGGGIVSVGGQNRSCIARLTPTGQLDASFNPNGGGFTRQIVPPLYKQAYVSSFVLNYDKLIVGGYFEQYHQTFVNNITRISMVSNNIIGRPGNQENIDEEISFGENHEIMLYPNPASDVLNISLGDANDLPEAYSIYNNLGQVIAQKAISSNADLSINTSDLAAGIYFIRIAKVSAVKTLKFLKK